MFTKSSCAAVVFLAGLSVSTSCHAQMEVMPTKKPTLSALQLLLLSHDVAAYGRVNKDPLSLITAARLQRFVAQKDVSRVAEFTNETPPPPNDPAQSLLEEAKALSQNDPVIVAMAQDILASKAKGRVNGVAVSRGKVAPGKTDVFKGQNFESGKYAEAYVEAQGNGEVRLSVYDEKGNLICKDANPADTSYCGWWPSETQPFTLKLESRSDAPVAYKVSTN